jgi:hypothetical protein
MLSELVAVEQVDFVNRRFGEKVEDVSAGSSKANDADFAAFELVADGFDFGTD